jgi:hypothetical protein
MAKQAFVSWFKYFLLFNSSHQQKEAEKVMEMYSDPVAKEDQHPENTNKLSKLIVKQGILYILKHV